MEIELLKGLANAGPSALIAAVLLWQFIKEREADRQLLNGTLAGMKESVDALREVIALQAQTLERLGQATERSLKRYEETLPSITCRRESP